MAQLINWPDKSYDNKFLSLIESYAKPLNFMMMAQYKFFKNSVIPRNLSSGK